VRYRSDDFGGGGGVIHTFEGGGHSLDLRIVWRRKARLEPSFAKQVPREYLAEEPSSSNDDDSRNVYERRESWNLFYHMKCGIFIMIWDGKLQIFSPFVNADYRNTWGNNLAIEGGGSLRSYYLKKDGLYRDEEIEPDKSKWWANGNIICNKLSMPKDRERTQFWGDHFLAALRDMISVLERTSKINF
jgi:hypothetical protein